MVYYFTSNVVEPGAYVYMGKDKVENEELIKYGWDEDLWVHIPHLPARTYKRGASNSHAWVSQFHADKLSSAHIYLRLNEGQNWEYVSPELLTDCCQLTKANSIEGSSNKKDNVNIVYTPWSNLKKDGSMAVGQVGFKDQRKVKKVLVEARANVIINRLNKTKVEKFPDLAAEREQRDKTIRDREKRLMLEREKEEARVVKERKEKAWQKDHAYDDVFTEDALEESSNDRMDANFYDNFM